MRLIDADALLNSGFPTIYHTEFGDEVINTDDIRNAPTVDINKWLDPDIDPELALENIRRIVYEQ